MSRKILTAVLLLLAAALVAAPQANTFCANNLACTVSAAWNFTGGLQNNGVAVPVLPINLATQITGTLPGTNYAQVNLAASGNGGVGGVLPGADIPATTSNCTGVQFAQGLNAGMTPVCTTPPTFVASGASHAVGYVPDPGSSAGTTRFLREDATFAVPPAGGVTESTLSWGSNSQTTPTTAGCFTGGIQCVEVFFSNSHTLVRLNYELWIQAVGCSPNAVIGLQDITSSATVASLTVAAGGTGFKDSGALSVAMTAGHRYALEVITAASGCTTTPSVGSLTAVFQ